MTLMQIWGVLVVFLLCPFLGALPLIRWIIQFSTGQDISQIGTGNISVSAAFYHGGKLAGILAVLSEALKGILAVLLARFFFPHESAWEIVALITLVIGRYSMGKGAGTTNVVWGIVVHDIVTAGLVLLIGSISFTILRERKWGRLGILVLFPLILILRHPYNEFLGIAALTLSLLIAWIYQNIPDDLDLPVSAVQSESQAMFQFFRGDRAIVSLDAKLEAAKVGQKAATLSQLRGWGYPVPAGWVLNPGDDPEPLIESLNPSLQYPFIVRSSALGEDSLHASAAGQYESILNITDRDGLRQAIFQCLNSYNHPNALEYRRQRRLPDTAMAVLIQQQVKGVFSGVAFSRNPINRHGEDVAIEALPGDATRVVSGQVTPEQYRVLISQTDRDASLLPVEGNGDVPPAIIQQIALLTRQLEERYQGIPQDVEWSYDGKQLWILQSRPITTLLPIWTRKIAAEVIPGLIRPLTWSINRPLTCSVWGEIFRVVLGDRLTVDLDFNKTATLIYSRAYFNASLLGEIFLRMGLPPESLEFLTRGAKFSKPPLKSTLKQLPGLWRLLRREWRLEQDFERDYQERFYPSLQHLHSQTASTPQQLLDRIELILETLKGATYYSILAPLSLAFRQALLKVPETELDNQQTPEVAAVVRLREIAIAARHILPDLDTLSPETLFGRLAELPEGQNVLDQFEQFLNQYGYLSEVATDIAVPRWKEDPKPVRELFVRLMGSPQSPKTTPHSPQSIKTQLVQTRLNLKGKVTEIYSQLLAELRWSFVALEKHWLQSKRLSQTGDLFFLNFNEVCRLVTESDPELITQIPQLILTRRHQLQEDQKLTPVPPVVYGNTPPTNLMSGIRTQPLSADQNSILQGIGASPGLIEGYAKIIHHLREIPEIPPNTILVVPYTDSGWSPLLARASGLIAEVGGKLSHGAIIAREYGIPAVMDIPNATHRFQDGQLLRLDGTKGTVEIIKM